MKKIKVTVLFTDGSTDVFVGVSFQHGEKALSLETERGSYLAIPNDKVRAYEVEKIEAEEQDGEGVVDAEVSTEDSGVQEEEASEEKETS